MRFSFFPTLEKEKEKILVINEFVDKYENTNEHRSVPYGNAISETNSRTYKLLSLNIQKE